MDTESKIGQCPECIVRESDKAEKQLFLCSFCEKWLCEKHIQPKPCYIVNLGKNDPNKWNYLNDSSRGHPDPIYTERQERPIPILPLTPTEETKLPEPPDSIPIEVEERKNRPFGTCPKCKCTDSEIIKDYPGKAILKCWNCHLKYGQRKYPPYHYIRLRKRRPQSTPQRPRQQPITRSNVTITPTPRTSNRKKNNSAKKLSLQGLL